MKRSSVLALITLGLLAAAACSDQATGPRLTSLQGALAGVMQVQGRHTPQLLRVPGVVGTATGIDPSGHAVLVDEHDQQALASVRPMQRDGAGQDAQVGGTGRKREGEEDEERSKESWQHFGAPQRRKRGSE